MMGLARAGKDLGKFRWLARKQAPRVVGTRGAEMQAED